MMRRRHPTQTPRWSSGILASIVLFLAACALPWVAAHDAGEVLLPGAPELTLPLKNLASGSICYIDGNGNSAYASGEPVILDVSGGCSGNSAGNDVRLVEWEGNPAGAVLGSSNDAFVPLSSPSSTANLRFYDANGDRRLNVGDTLYVNLVNPTSNTADVGDVRLTAYGSLPGGTYVTSGDGDRSLSLRPIESAVSPFGYVDASGNNAFDGTDLVYVNSDDGGTETVESGDVRITGLSDEFPSGSFVEPGHPDAANELTRIVRDICYVDDDGSGTYTAGDGVFLILDENCGGSVSTADLRLSAKGDDDAGRVVTGDAAIGHRGKVIDAKFAYVDQDGNSRFSDGDIAFIDLVSTGDRRVNTGDIRLTPESSQAGGILVEAGDTYAGRELRHVSDIRDRLAFVSQTGASSPGANDPVYINLDGGTTEPVEPLDIRLQDVAGRPFGGSASVATGEARAVLIAASATICVTTPTDTNYVAGDGIYLIPAAGCGNGPRAGSVRITAVGAYPAGSVVLTTDRDHAGHARAPTEAPSWKFFDANGDTLWSEGDTMYLDMISLSSNRVDVGDVRISVFGDESPMSAIVAGAGDISLPLASHQSISGGTFYADADPDGAPGAGDLYYINADATGTSASIMDVRLVHLPEPADIVVPDEDEAEHDPVEDDTPSGDDAPPDDTPVESPDDTPSDDDTTGSTPDEPADPVPPTNVPGPGVALTLAFLACLVLVQRRK